MAAQVFGAAPVSKRASKANGPATTRALFIGVLSVRVECARYIMGGVRLDQALRANPLLLRLRGTRFRNSPKGLSVAPAPFFLRCINYFPAAARTSDAPAVI